MDEAERCAVEVRQRMGVLEGREDLYEHTQVHRERHGQPVLVGAPDDSLQRLPVHVFHRQEAPGSMTADLDRLHQVRVVQPGGDPRLVEEHLDGGRVAQELVAQLFDREKLVESGGSPRDRQMDDTHAAARQLADELVLPEAAGGAGVPGGPSRGRSQVIRVHGGRVRPAFPPGKGEAPRSRKCHASVAPSRAGPRSSQSAASAANRGSERIDYGAKQTLRASGRAGALQPMRG